MLRHRLCLTVLIGCDGIKSRVRCCLFAENSEVSADKIEGKATRQKYSGWIVYRGVVPAELVKKALCLSDAENIEPRLWSGKDRVRSPTFSLCPVYFMPLD